MVKVVSASIGHSCTGIKWAEKNENAPDSGVMERCVEQPSPENCSPPDYDLSCCLAMAPMGLIWIMSNVD